MHIQRWSLSILALSFLLLPKAVLAQTWDGQWAVNETVNAAACGEGTYVDSFTATVTQNGSQITVTTNGITRSGTLEGNTVNYSVNYPEDGGTTTATGSFTFNGDQVTGNSSWSWTDGEESCQGTSIINGSRLTTTQLPSGPIPEAVKVTTIGGSARNAEIRLGAYSSTGEPAYGNDFTTGDFITILGEITPDPVDVGINGELFAAMLSVVAGQANFSFLNADGNFEAWDTTLPGLGAAAMAAPLEESHELRVFEGTLQAGIHKITFAYQAEGGPLVYMKPITLRITD